MLVGLYYFKHSKEGQLYTKIDLSRGRAVLNFFGRNTNKAVSDRSTVCSIDFTVVKQPIVQQMKRHSKKQIQETKTP